MIDSGLRDVGYNYVVLDDCWASLARDADDMLVADPTKFPNGMKYVSDRIHEMGMLFGMYSSAGEMTCARYRECSYFSSLDSSPDTLQPGHWITRRMMRRLLPNGVLITSNMITALTKAGSEHL